MSDKQCAYKDCLTFLSKKQVREDNKYCNRDCYYKAIKKKTTTTQPRPSLKSKYSLNQRATELSLSAVIQFKIMNKKPTDTDIKRITDRLRKELNVTVDEARGYLKHARSTLDF